MEEMIKIAGVVRESIVDGPGIRYVVFTQGCPHKCEGCHNPQTHDFEGGKYVRISDIVNDIKKNPILKGVTISGGEPFMQARQVAKLLKGLESENLDVLVYTGFEYEYLLRNSDQDNGYMDLLYNTDILIDGKFDMAKKSFFLPFRGSTNQRAINVQESLEKEEIVMHDFVSQRSNVCIV